MVYVLQPHSGNKTSKYFLHICPETKSPLLNEICCIMTLKTLYYLFPYFHCIGNSSALRKILLLMDADICSCW